MTPMLELDKIIKQAPWLCSWNKGKHSQNQWKARGSQIRIRNYKNSIEILEWNNAVIRKFTGCAQRRWEKDYEYEYKLT